jgi:uncharacterized Fe-S cluster-containing protein
MIATNVELPGLDCGLCGYRTCDEFRVHLSSSPESIRRCIHISENRMRPDAPVAKPQAAAAPASCQTTCGGCATVQVARPQAEKGDSPHLPERPGGCLAQTGAVPFSRAWQDSLGRDFDFYLEHFPEDPGPREIILPHNPAITREIDVQVGDILIGRPLGMSCGCPITHCGVATQVDVRTGVIVWCVTGPLGPRQHGYKDLGYYVAEGYEGLVKETRAELKVGLRYFFQPKMCMLQWRHSGLLNYLNRTGDHYQVRLEGLWIG